jgi:oxygen-independent coproporphyrinogen III oxidase
MRILDAAPETIPQLVSDLVRADYVYMYPPRQAYRPLPQQETAAVITANLLRSAPLNLYIHVPFCRQICAFCNLYTIAGVRESEHTRYVEAVESEIDHYAPLISGRPVDTIYVGGGTPSILDPALIGRLLRHLRAAGMGDPAKVPEVALEVAPDTATPEALAGFHDVGINRINLGAQTWVDSELSVIGRRHGVDVLHQALETALSVGFSNVCVDLIYGLEGQTDASWEHSVAWVTSYRPETMCCYPLTLRPRTGFASRGYSHVESEAQYRRYDIAHEMLTAAGYVQETHVRWVLPGRGGYRQKHNHWAGQDILGIGAGARSYLYECDTRNGYSVRHRAQALHSYYARVAQTGHARTDGFLMDDDERRRKDAILGLGALDRHQYSARHGVDALDAFADEFGELQEIGAVTVSDDVVALTPLGQRHRDVLVQTFFSDHVRSLVASHDYNE